MEIHRAEPQPPAGSNGPPYALVQFTLPKSGGGEVSLPRGTWRAVDHVERQEGLPSLFDGRECRVAIRERAERPRMCACRARATSGGSTVSVAEQL